jgi:uncharacterized protein (UPF0218 family)
MSTGSSLFEFDRFAKDLRLPDDLRAEVGTAIGPIVSSEELLEAVASPATLACVGDFCSASVLTQGLVPDVIVVDFKTRRGEDEELEEYFDELGWTRLEVDNPAGMLTRSMWEGIAEAYKSEERVMVAVHGEEDLATMPCIALAPLESVVLYGMPGKGVVVVRVDEEAKRKVKSVLLQMEKANGN